MNIQTKAWHSEAINLFFNEGYSKLEVSKKLGVARSTMSDFLRKMEGFYEKENSLAETFSAVNSRRPIIEIFDIETSKIMAYVWGLWNQNISIDNIIQDWYVLMFSHSRLEEEEVHNYSVHNWELPESGNYIDNERYVVEACWKVLDDADIVVAHNGKAFDKKKMNAKFLQYGLPEPAPYKVVDTLKIAKGNFNFTSNKLDYIAHFLGNKGKHDTNDQLWIDCMRGDEKSLDRMSNYCDNDVAELKEVYLILRPWDKSHPNMAIYYKDNQPRCGCCGSPDVHKMNGKYALTMLSQFEVWKCNSCGNPNNRGRINQLPKEKRASLFMQVRG